MFSFAATLWLKIAKNLMKYREMFIVRKEIELVAWKLQLLTGDSEILVDYIKLAAYIDFFVMS